MQRNIVPVILAGGEGRRLRPLTAPTRPKPFLKIFGGYSLLQMTLLRVAAFMPPLIACDRNFAALAASEARQAGVAVRMVIAEPVQRSTAAAIAVAAFVLQEENPLMLVMPSDHFIEDADMFVSDVARAAEIADESGPVILGKKPTRVNTSYGYVQAHEEGGRFVLDGFIEKPDAATARELMRAPCVFWNTGVFMCRARELLKLLSAHAPEIFESAGHAIVNASHEGWVLQPDPVRYARIPATPIDRALMEKLHAGSVLPLETAWHDVGCWERLVAQKVKLFAQRARRPRPDALEHDRKKSASA